jgi:hypothetical protein
MHHWANRFLARRQYPIRFIGRQESEIEALSKCSVTGVLIEPTRIGEPASARGLPRPLGGQRGQRASPLLPLAVPSQSSRRRWWCRFSLGKRGALLEMCKPRTQTWKLLSPPMLGPAEVSNLTFFIFLAGLLFFPGPAPTNEVESIVALCTLGANFKLSGKLNRK